ncbi:hypothetical protein ABZ916_31530 [Streptomyces sp. NPDC046853]|uniref:hypothetical protein n=1 Tax=Streptomyces sp. NPDC046853 TaxID=3154920 RepID=UPI003405459C
MVLDTLGHDRGDRTPAAAKKLASRARHVAEETVVLRNNARFVQAVLGAAPDVRAGWRASSYSRVMY